MFHSLYRIHSAHTKVFTPLSALTNPFLSKTLSSSSTTTTKPTNNVAISTTEFTPLTVSQNKVIGQNVYKITLDFPNKTDILGMTTAGMLMVEGEMRDGNGVIARPYTPVSRNDTVGKVELVVKDYPDVGNASSYICNAEVGSSISVKGCFSKIEVKPNKWNKVGMIAGGSGITPCLQVAEELLSHSEDTTEITLIFCNKTPTAIFLKDHIDALISKSQGRFKVHYCVDKTENDNSWEGLTGYVTAEMVKVHLPGVDGVNNIIMVCGPPNMYNALCGPKKFEEGKPPAQGEISGILKDLGFASNSVFKF